MEKAICEIIEKHLSKKINGIWAVCSKTGRKIPYIVEEAGFNSLLLASIYEYIDQNEDDFSFAVSEAAIERYDSKNCRGDIIWYRNDDICYFELKGSCYGSSNSLSDVSNAEKSIEYAKYQLQGIKYTNNEAWYKVNPKIRYGCCLAMIQSINNEGQSNYDELKKELELNKELRIFYTHKFSAENLPIITDGTKEYKNDGYFIIGNIYNIGDFNI